MDRLVQVAPFLRDARDEYSEHKKSLIVRFSKEILGEGNIDVADEIVYPEVIVHDIGMPLSWLDGRDGVKESAKALQRAFDDIEFTLNSATVVRAKVEVRWTMLGVHKHAYLGVPPTGQMSRMTGTSLFLLQPSGPGAMIAEY